MVKINEEEENIITINNVKYIKKDSLPKNISLAKKSKTGKKYVLIRTYSAGVHVGYLEKRSGKEVKLSDSRRIWYWKGAASLSELAIKGIKNPDDCKFSVVIPEIELTEAIEIIPVSDVAKESINGVKEWTA